MLGKLVKTYNLRIGVDQLFRQLKTWGYVELSTYPGQSPKWVLTKSGEEYGYEYMNSIFWYVDKFKEIVKELEGE